MDILCDIDGTIADLRHRLHYISPPKKNWGLFEKHCGEDEVIYPVRNLIYSLAQAGNRVIFCSGRSSMQRDATRKWLMEKALLWDPDKIDGCPGLFMRQKGDYRKDSIVKSELLDVMINQHCIDPEIIFDDRQQVVDMWRSRGYQVCQVAPGDF